MKYKLINRKTNEEHLCEKVTIEGWDYYVNDEVPKNEDYGLTKLNTITKIGYGFDYKLYKKVIATNDPSTDIPKVVDEVEELAKLYASDFLKDKDLIDLQVGAYLEGYSKSQETHPFSEKDMIEFVEWVDDNYHSIDEIETEAKTTQELLQLWKHKVIYYQ